MAEPEGEAAGGLQGPPHRQQGPLPYSLRCTCWVVSAVMWCGQGLGGRPAHGMPSPLTCLVKSETPPF